MGIGGFGFGGGGFGMGGGVAVGGRGGGSASADTFAARETIRAGAYPNDHLFAGEITVAPHARIKRWLLFQFESKRLAKPQRAVGVDFAVTSRSGDRERRYVLVF